MADIPPPMDGQGGEDHADAGQGTGTGPAAEKVTEPVKPGDGAAKPKGPSPVIEGHAEPVGADAAGAAGPAAGDTSTPRDGAAQGTNGAEAAKKTWGERFSQKRKEIGESFAHEFDAEGKAIAGSELSAGKKYGIKGGVTALGGLGMIDGVRRMATKDEEGNRHWVVGGVEFAGGAGAAYWALTKKFLSEAAKTAARAG